MQSGDKLCGTAIRIIRTGTIHVNQVIVKMRAPYSYTNSGLAIFPFLTATIFRGKSLS